MPQSPIKLKFPKIKRVTLTGFSLYTAQPTLDITFPDGVFCLTGANGLGKSTFLAALNFGLTGIVSEPGRKFEAEDEYYRYCQKFTEKYFTGRITDVDREIAEVKIEFSIGQHDYEIIRGVFEPTALRYLSILETQTGSELFTKNDCSESERQNLYGKWVASDIGVNDFYQFVFIQHFILTFDERRLLLFFDERVIERALYLVFGIDHSQTQRASVLRREIDSADSKVRNYQYHANEQSKRIRELEAGVSVSEVKDTVSDNLAEQYEELVQRHEESSRDQERIKEEIKDAQLKLASASSERYALQSDYDGAFKKHIRGKFELANHPLLANSLTEKSCGICGTSGDQVVVSIKQKLKETSCFLCGSELSIDKQDNKQGIQRLKDIDKKIAQAQTHIDEALKAISRLTGNSVAQTAELNDINQQIEEFERKNTDVLQHLRRVSKLSDPDSFSSDLTRVLESYKASIASTLKRKNEFLQKREEKKSLLRKLQKEVEKQYIQAEEKFVPIFTKLARLFLGLDLEIRLETRSSPGVKLSLEIKGNVRRENYQLSESQRFFIDIALRMAMIQFVSDPESKAPLFIDTPEGSLDIAYENRAGKMLARFAKDGHQLVMTANVNSSRMLLELASQCGEAHMYLCRMTEWADLSDVQNEEEDLFTKAYADITQALKGGAEK
jgi:DNA repair exonuclease SbcCD ATPase subunit